MQRVCSIPLAKKLAKELKPPTQAQEKLIASAGEIALSPGTADDACYLHAVLCQVGMPRKRTDSLSFERTNGSASLLLTAGKVWNGREWVQQSLPYGAKPRLIMINLTTAALCTKNRVVDVGRSTREFMKRIGVTDQGIEYRRLREQIGTLSACTMRLGWVDHRGIVQNHPSVNPIERFEVWVSRNPDQQTIWPQTVELSQKYYEGILEHAVPLDERAVAALRGSALALDVYTWLAHRLYRIRDPNGTPVRWARIKAQFGQEYRAMKPFREKFRAALAAVVSQYRTARIEETKDGLRLWQSPPPIQPRVLIPGQEL
jgi:hypothetical protein